MLFPYLPGGGATSGPRASAEDSELPRLTARTLQGYDTAAATILPTNIFFRARKIRRDRMVRGFGTRGSSPSIADQAIRRFTIFNGLLSCCSRTAASALCGQRPSISAPAAAASVQLEKNSTAKAKTPGTGRHRIPHRQRSWSSLSDDGRSPSSQRGPHGRIHLSPQRILVRIRIRRLNSARCRSSAP